MKIRKGYVSNSSSSSFLISKDVSDITDCIKLSQEIWKAIEKNYIDWDGNKLNLSELSNEWYLTSLISDCDKAYEKIWNMPNKILYIEGHDEPYDWFDNPKSYTVFRKNYIDYYIKNHDLIGINNDDIPSCIEMRNKLTKIIKNSHLNKTQKLNIIKDYLQIC